MSVGRGKLVEWRFDLMQNNPLVIVNVGDKEGDRVCVSPILVPSIVDDTKLSFLAGYFLGCSDAMHNEVTALNIRQRLSEVSDKLLW